MDPCNLITNTFFNKYNFGEPCEACRWAAYWKCGICEKLTQILEGREKWNGAKGTVNFHDDLVFVLNDLMHFCMVFFNAHGSHPDKDE